MIRGANNAFMNGFSAPGGFGGTYPLTKPHSPRIESHPNIEFTIALGPRLAVHLVSWGQSEYAMLKRA